MIQMQRGFKKRLSELTSTASLQVGVRFDNPQRHAIDISCFGLDTDGKLSDDRYFIFYNQKSSPCGSLSMTDDSQYDQKFHLDLVRLPIKIQKLVFVANIDGSGKMADISNGEFTVIADNQKIASFSFTGALFSQEKAVIIGEIYMKSVWRVAAVGQGFNGGLKAVLEYFGGEASTPPPKPKQKPKSTISLIKGQSISLTKKGKSLRHIAVGIGWAKRVSKKGRKKSVDFDASCIAYGRFKKKIDVVWFGHLTSKDRSIQHAGDDTTGGGSEKDANETINVDLTKVSAKIMSIIFVVNSYSGETFQGVPSAFCNVIDTDTRREIARYDLVTDGKNYKGFIIAKVYREGENWKFQALGEPAKGKQKKVSDIERQAKQFA